MALFTGGGGLRIFRADLVCHDLESVTIWEGLLPCLHDLCAHGPATRDRPLIYLFFVRAATSDHDRCALEEVNGESARRRNCVSVGAIATYLMEATESPFWIDVV